MLDPFIGSGTTLYECENLGRKCVGLDINAKILQTITQNLANSNPNFYVAKCDNTNTKEVDFHLQIALEKLKAKSVQFIIYHPPYMDIIHFTKLKEDLSNSENLQDFCTKFLQTCKNTLKYLDKNRYFALVIGDVYKNSEVKPLAFYSMDF